MIGKKQTHPVLDAKEFEIIPKEIARWKRFFTGQPAVLLIALESLAKERPSKRVSGRDVREHLEKNRARFFPSCGQKDITRVFQGYHSQLVRAGVIRDLVRREGEAG